MKDWGSPLAAKCDLRFRPRPTVCQTLGAVTVSEPLELFMHWAFVHRVVVIWYRDPFDFESNGSAER